MSQWFGNVSVVSCVHLRCGHCVGLQVGVANPDEVGQSLALGLHRYSTLSSLCWHGQVSFEVSEVTRKPLLVSGVWLGAELYGPDPNSEVSTEARAVHRLLMLLPDERQVLLGRGADA